MMGTADELPKEPSERPTFMEDMTDQQLATAVCANNISIYENITYLYV